MEKMMEKRLMILALSVLLPFCTVAQADIITAYEPPVAGTSTDAQYPDGSPLGYSNPCEIYGMAIETLGSGRIKFEIQTNFGDLTSRQTYDTTTGYTWMDTYSSGWGMQNVAAGDLYIRVYTPGGTTPDRLFGLVLEDRDGDDSDPWFQPLDYAGYTSVDEFGADNPYDKVKKRGELWQLSGDGSGFATGTYEGYADNFTEIPQMSDAQALPGLIDLASLTGDLDNAYPTLLLNGTKVDTNSSAAWVANPLVAGGYLDPAGPSEGDNYGGGVWRGEFTLPSYALGTGDEVSIWWSMQCGNDGVAITGVTGVEVPLPGSLVLCCFGLGFMAVRRLKIRK